jgi:hypothetical protein
MDISRKIFVSYKYKDPDVYPLSEYVPGADTNFLHTPRHYVDKIIEKIGVDHIYKGELGDEGMDDFSDDTIDSVLKKKIFDSSITIVLISPNMRDKARLEKDQWIAKEIAYSLRNKTRGEKTSKTNGMLMVALPDLNGNYDHAVIDQSCGVRSWQSNSFFRIIRKNMFNRLDKNHTFCNVCLGYHHYSDDHSYIHPVIWKDFIIEHNAYIDHAIALRDRLDEFDLTIKHE